MGAGAAPACPLAEGRLRENVQAKLPKRLREVVAKRMRAAYRADTALAAEGLLVELTRELDQTHRDHGQAGTHPPQPPGASRTLNRPGNTARPPFLGQARILDPSEEQTAEQAIRANYRWFRRIYLRLLTSRIPARYVEVVPS